MFMIKEQPLCPVFGECGGCLYQNLPYQEELNIKEEQLRNLFKTTLNIQENLFESIEPSPKIYHYRHRLDLSLQRTRESGVLMGFSPRPLMEPSRLWRGGIVPVESCAIAAEEISKFLPQLRNEALQKFPADYRQANLVVRCGDQRKISWGGIGKKSLKQTEDNYFWTEIFGRKIFYSLETFFQANLSILPKIFNYLYALALWGQGVHLYDLYGGVGLFGIGLKNSVHKVTLIEDSIQSIELAEYNVRYHQLKNFRIIKGKVEQKLPDLLEEKRKPDELKRVAIIDPPRAGLSRTICKLLSEKIDIDHLLYLSCNPETLARDLKTLTETIWQIVKIKPFDFFPRTKHLETLVVLRKAI